MVKGEKNIIVILYNRNFIGRNDVNLVIYVFVIFFELVIVLFIVGILDFNLEIDFFFVVDGMLFTIVLLIRNFKNDKSSVFYFIDNGLIYCIFIYICSCIIGIN